MGSVRPLCSQPSYVVTENHPDLHSFGAAGGFTEVVDPDDHDAVVGVLAPAAAEGAERVLAVGAHPDDVEIGCGATLLRHSQQGRPVTVLTLSGGAVGGPSRGPGDRGCRGGYGDVGATADGGFTGHAAGRGSGDDRHHRTGHRCGPADNDVHAFSCRHLSRSPGGAREGVDRRPPRAAGFCYQSRSAQNGFAPSKFVPVDETINAKVAVLEQYRSQSTPTLS